nr:hypothetical protein CFP56_00874 [Quercus suber]
MRRDNAGEFRSVLKEEGYGRSCRSSVVDNVVVLKARGMMLGVVGVGGQVKIVVEASRWWWRRWRAWRGRPAEDDCRAETARGSPDVEANTSDLQ